MKRCLLTLVLGGLSVLALRADPITSGNIARAYSYLYPGMGGPIESDVLELSIPSGEMNFRILLNIMTDAIPFYGLRFTDHVAALTTLVCFNLSPCSLPDGGVLGTLNLDIVSSLTSPVSQYPGPTNYTGLFSATGSFSAPGIAIPLIGAGTTTLVLETLYDRDPGYYFYGPQLIRYDFVPVPEPAMMFTTGLGLLALVLLWSWGRRTDGDHGAGAMLKATLSM